jgi:hypothetical protein
VQVPKMWVQVNQMDLPLVMVPMQKQVLLHQNLV